MARQQRKVPDRSVKLDELLEERRRLDAWLSKLDQAEDKTPGEIKDRVREDYQRRLLAVVSQVKKFADQLERSLERGNKQRDALLEEERIADEKLAEAELRYNVGEFEEGKWEELKAELTKVKEQLTRQLEECTAEIDRLEEFLAGASDRPGSSKKPRKKPEKKEPQTDAFEGQEAAEPEEDQEAEEDQETIEAEAEELAGITVSATDELEQDEEPVAVAEEPHEEGQEEEPVIPDRPSASLSIPSESAEERPLKCPDCGTMNLATEWYCESCGAELASL